MGTREAVSCFVSPMSLDYTDEDRVALAIIGPRGGGQFYGVMSPIQARQLRDELDIALLKIRDAEVRREDAAERIVDQGKPGSIDHMPERNSDDLDEEGYPR